jgi:hypothetical protein
LDAAPAFARNPDGIWPLLPDTELLREHDTGALRFFRFRRAVPAFPRFAN